MLTLHTKTEKAEKIDGQLILPYELRENPVCVPIWSVAKMSLYLPSVVRSCAMAI